MKRWMIVLCALTFLATGSAPGGAAEAPEPCPTLEDQPVKIEGYISKKHRKQSRAIFKEFAAMGNTKVRMRVFPMGKTAKVVGIGRCVPAFIARHVLQTALKYTDGVESLVNPAFLSPHYFAVGATMFDEPSQQTITPEQLQQLLDESLTTEAFQALYKKLTIQDDEVHFFGLKVPNAKIPGFESPLHKK